MQPGPLSNYPRAPIEEVSFSTIGEAWGIVTKNIGPFLVASLLAFVLSGIPIGIGYSLLLPSLMAQPNPDASMSDLFAKSMGQNIILYPFVVLGYAVAAPVNVGMMRMALKHSAGIQPEFSDITVGFSKFIPLAITGALVYLGVLVGSLCCYVPGLLFGGITMLALPLVMDQDMSPVDAIKESIQRLKKHMWMAMLLYLVIMIVSGLGVIACCIGIFLTLPLAQVVPALVYRDFMSPKTFQPVGMPMATTEPMTEEPRPTDEEPPANPEA